MEVILLMAMTLDGKIARTPLHPVDWSGPADKAYFVQKTREAGVMIMGSRTFDTIGNPLPGRQSIVLTRNPEQRSKAPGLVFTRDPPEKIVSGLQARGIDRVTLIGGAEVNTLFMEAGLITQIHVTVVPRLFGQGLSLFNSALDVGLVLKETRQLDPGHLLLIYQVRP
jgi:dihydrofolate reductase